MKLSQVYSSKPFKNVRFNDGFNIILGKVTRPKDQTVDSHNLGKTTLIEIINFLLLKEIDQKHFLNKYADKFSQYVFFLEIHLNNGKYLTIRRSVESDNKISMLFHDDQYADHTKTIKWDYADIPVREAKDILNKSLNFDVLPNMSYRNTVSYFLRTQDDYQNVFQLNKYRSGKDIKWKPMLFDLLGFNGKLLTEKYTFDQSAEEIKNVARNLKNKSETDVEEKDKIKGLIEVKENEKKIIKNQLENFNFYQQEHRINLKLLEEVENEISRLNTARYNLDFEIDRINKSLQNKIAFDVDEITSVFKEVNIYFPDQLKKSYKELVEFNKQLYSEREKHLQARLVELKGKLKNVDKELIEFNNKQSELLSVLNDNDALNKFKKYQSELVQIETEILHLQEELKKLNQIDQLNEESKQFLKKSDLVKDEIKKEVDESANETFANIRLVFNQIVKDIVNLPAIPSIKINQNGNVEFEADIQDIKQTEITAKGKGTTYRKILCVAFDLSVLITYSSRSFFKFVYHDGVLEGLDNRKKINFINTVKKICKEYDLQYIITSIEDDLPRNESGKIITFEKNEIALELDDKGDEGRLFKTSF